MWQLLGSVVSGFLLLRDLFGYLIPGAVFLFFLQVNPVPLTKNVFGTDDKWIVGLVVIIACYVAGHVLAAIGYTIYDIADFLKKIACKIIAGDDHSKKLSAKEEKEARDKAKKEAIQRDANILFHRYLYPALFNERDRRATINILRIGLAVALLAAATIASWIGSPFPHWIFIAAGLIGLFMLWNGYTGGKHVGGYGEATILAGQMAVKEKVPFFRWSGPEKEADGKKKSGE